MDDRDVMLVCQILGGVIGILIGLLLVKSGVLP